MPPRPAATGDRRAVSIRVQFRIEETGRSFFHIVPDEVFSTQDTNQCYNLFIDKYTYAFNKAFPLIRVSRKQAKDKQWITKGIKISIRHKNRLYKKYVNKPNDINKAAYKNYKNKLTSLIRFRERITIVIFSS